MRPRHDGFDLPHMLAFFARIKQRHWRAFVATVGMRMMGAEVTWTVRVLITHEAVVEVSAVTETEALERAERLPGVVTALGIADVVGGSHD